MGDHWVHDLDPFLWQISGEIGIRWYGLAYLAGIVLGYLLMKRWQAQRLVPLTKEGMGDLVVYLGLGMILGGRLGYCLLYQPSLFIEFDGSFPFWGVLKINQGGMASHGGIAGFFIGGWLMWRKHRFHYVALGDSVATVIPIGISCGRIANFINGELWGRPTDVSWAVHFPASMRELDENELLIRWAEFLQDHPDLPRVYFRDYAATLMPGSAEYDAFYRAMTELRHPSQLYAAVLEGVIVLAIAWFLFGRHRRPGLNLGLVLGMYGIGRFINEFWREPDPGYGLFFGWMSKGQLYSLPVVVAGAWLIIRALRRPAQPEAYEPPPEPAATSP